MARITACAYVAPLCGRSGAVHQVVFQHEGTFDAGDVFWAAVAVLPLQDRPLVGHVSVVRVGNRAEEITIYRPKS
jgi:hypothetical protein